MEVGIMPSDRKQINVRLENDAVRKLKELRASMKAAIGNEFSQADVIAAALTELQKKYPPVGVAEEPQRRSRKQ
jgi:hypothetical protein